MVVLMSGLAFAVCSLAQTPADLSRQLYAYHALCDLLLIADVGWIAQALAGRFRSDALVPSRGVIHYIRGSDRSRRGG